MSQGNRSLVVGVDGSEASLGALDWAADEAQHHGWPVQLVNAYLARLPDVAFVGRKPAVAKGDEAAKEIFATARQRLDAGGYAGVEVSTATHEGRPREVLLRAAAEARALVVGREGTGRVADLLVGSTSLACAMHSRQTPVVVVPASWDATRSRERPERLVVVGVDGSRRCRAAIDYAFSTASDRSARLVAVLASDAGSEASQFLTDTLAGWTSKHPDVPLTKVVEFEHPAVAIRRHSHEADLVVIGGRGHGEVTGMLLGSVARAVLYLVDRPTAVVHQPR